LRASSFGLALLYTFKQLLIGCERAVIKVGDGNELWLTVFLKGQVYFRLFIVVIVVLVRHGVGALAVAVLDLDRLDLPVSVSLLELLRFNEV
jgi:hypothetical protein